ncbi:MAG: hypothetical protein R6V33_04035 [Pelovirga sp.]
MRRCLAYVAAGALFLLLQSTLLAFFLPPPWRPNLILILVLLLGIKEKPVPAMLTVLVIGALQDSLGGATIGFHITTSLAVFILIRLLTEKLNVESPALLTLMLIGANFFQGLLVGFIMMTFTDYGTVLYLLATTLPQQTLSTLVVFFMMMAMFPGWILATPKQSDKNGRLFRGELM